MAATPPFVPPPMLLFMLSELNPEMRRNPHALLDAQRARAAAERDPSIPVIVITSYEAGREMLTDPSLSRNFENASSDNFVISAVLKVNAALEAEFGRHDTMVVLEGQDHARVRGIVAKAFLARAAAARPLIEAAVAAALQRLDGRTGFDVVGEYACRVPIQVLGRILGCAPEDLDQLRAWTEAGQNTFDPTKSETALANAIEGRRGILNYFRELMAARRVAPSDDLVSDLLAVQAAGAPISDNEMLHNLFALLSAGHLTTADLIGNGIMLLLEHAGARARIEVEPGLIAHAVDEVLRYDPPIAQTARFPNANGVVVGCPYHAGDALAVNLLAANHDPAAFVDPHKFDIARRPNPHLAFGAGSHMCLGAPLARLEGQAAILGLLRHFPKLRRADTAELDWRATPGVRGLATFEVAVD